MTSAFISAKSVDKTERFIYNNSTKKAMGNLMSVTATRLKNNYGQYLLLSATEDIFITKNEKVMTKLTNPCQDRVQTAKSLFGILPKDANLEESKKDYQYSMVKALLPNDFIALTEEKQPILYPSDYFRFFANTAVSGFIGLHFRLHSLTDVLKSPFYAGFTTG